MISFQKMGVLLLLLANGELLGYVIIMLRVALLWLLGFSSSWRELKFGLYSF